MRPVQRGNRMTDATDAPVKATSIKRFVADGEPAYQFFYPCLACGKETNICFHEADGTATGADVPEYAKRGEVPPNYFDGIYGCNDCCEDQILPSDLVIVSLLASQQGRQN
jgi:hypothetical protein